MNSTAEAKTKYEIPQLIRYFYFGQVMQGTSGGGEVFDCDNPGIDEE